MTKFDRRSSITELSENDPYLKIKSFQDYKPLHSVPCKPLNVLLKQLNNDTRDKKEIQDEMSVLEERFVSNHRPPTIVDQEDIVVTSIKPKWKLDQKILDLTKTLNNEMKPILNKVPCDIWKFEKESNRHFNEGMSIELVNVVNNSRNSNRFGLNPITQRA
jgi:hypothetical protein